MKLSQFKIKNGVDRKVKFQDGEIIIENERLNGEVEFYQFTESKIKEIGKILPEIEEADDNYVIYRLIPYLCDISQDVDYEEFKEMLINPTKELAYIVSTLVDIMKDLFDMTEEMKRVETKALLLKNKYEDFVVNEENNEQKLDRLYSELSECKDKDKRKELIMEISKLSLKD